MDLLFDLTDRVAFVAGGHGEIARAVTRGLAARGCHVVLGARRVELCEEICVEVRQDFGVSASAVYLDVSDEKSVAAAVQASRVVTGRLDVLVNNAAIFWSALPEDVPLERGWRRVIEVNLTGTFIMSQAAGRRMLEQGSGSIINISSFAGSTGLPARYGSTLSYTTSKSAVNALTRDLALQWADRGVRVNALAPGFVGSGLADTIDKEAARLMESEIPMKRFGDPSDLVGAVVFLAGDSARYVTGAILSVDGGRSLV